MKSLSELTEREVVALAIANEEEDSRIYQSFADRLRPDFEASAHIFDDMAVEEREHRDWLYHLYRDRFGEHLPPIRREDVRGFLRRRTPWWEPSLDLDKMRGEAELMERQAANFYESAAQQSLDVSVRELFTKLAEIERGHERRAEEIAQTHLTKDTAAAEESARRRAFVLQYVQPGLAGLIDGSVSTLAPLFAAAFATHNNWETFLIGMAASVGAGISMGLTEALSDDGAITGRGSPLMRGIVCGVMTAVGGIGHTLPYLIPNSWPNAFYLATSIAAVVVIVELFAISWIRTKYMDTPFLRATFQVVVGGILVLLAGIFIGSA
jgi:rubrerythrin